MLVRQVERDREAAVSGDQEGAATSRDNAGAESVPEEANLSLARLTYPSKVKLVRLRSAWRSMASSMRRVIRSE
jgi:hypothetical protein